MISYYKRLQSVKERLPYRVLDENAWGLLRIHDDDGDDGGGDDDDDVLAEGVSSHFVCTATHRRTDKSDEYTCCKSHDITLTCKTTAIQKFASHSITILVSE